MTEWIEQTAGYWQAGGLLLLPIAGVSLGLWAYFFRSRAALRQTLANGKAITQAWRQSRLDGKSTDVRGLLSRFPGCVAGTMEAALADIGQGAAPLQAFTAREAECLDLLRRDFVVLAAFTAVAPLLGLLGTVAGMIFTFDAVAAVSGHTGARVAMGISQALITTQFGLVVALPGIFGLTHLERMARHVQVLMAECRAFAVSALEGPGGGSAT